MTRFPLWGKLLVVVGAFVAVCVALALIPSGDVAYAPVEPIDMAGRIDVNGVDAERVQGELYLVGVTEQRVSILRRLLLDLGDPNVDFGPEPADGASGGPSERDVQSMVDAKRLAAAIALDLNGEKVDWTGTYATIARVAPTGPAARALRAGDLLVSVNGVVVDNGVDAGKLINTRPPGTVLLLGLQRSGQALQVRVTTAPPVAGDEVNTSRIGVELESLGLDVKLPKGRKVEIDSGEVVGPSAGLAFALYIYDSVRASEDLLRGRHVVVTGSLAPNGAVLPVGRIRQKAISAQLANRDLFLVPAANAEDARAALDGLCSDQAQCLKVVPVTSVQDAIGTLLLSDDDLVARLRPTAVP